jgi:lipopolysaccharide/colanic/teichoic acid biosynthesis glycosyltransferase
MIRLFDLLCSVAGLVVLSPLFLVVGALIKLGDGGPVFYRQERVGRNGKHFRMMKFRTMSMGADRQGPLLTVGQDARITPVGAWLRKYKIDELPQLINVVLGQMGLVGPRPEVPRYVAVYTPDQARVLELRPGITDAASITYRHENDALPRVADPEAFYIENILPNKIRINLEYAAKATLWSNFKVILATLGLLEPPVRVRPSGDRRAFDRIPAAAPAQVSTPTFAEGTLKALDVSQGGALLAPSGLPVGSPCELVITPVKDAPPVTTRGTIIRSDEQGTVVRFSQPLPTGTVPDPED